MKRISRRSLLRTLPTLAGMAWLTRYSQPADASTTAAGIPLLSPEETLKRAQETGQLTVALVPTDWANYSGVIDAFSKKYSLPVKAIETKGNAPIVMDALRNSRELETNAPDVIDVPFEFGVQAKRENLLAPYFAAGWQKIPAFLKDAQGFWSGSHFGVMAFEVNTEMVPNPPQDWLDLLEPAYQGMLALAGDPRKSPLAAHTVMAAAAAMSNGRLGRRGSTPGMSFFGQLKKAGNLLPTVANRESLIASKTPITFRWDYHALQERDLLPNKIKVIVPKRGVLARTYVQGVNALASNPYGARLWMDYLHSDEGQNLLLNGYARSTWMGDLLKREAISADQLAKLPEPASYLHTIFPGAAQITSALAEIKEKWDSLVGLNFTS